MSTPASTPDPGSLRTLERGLAVLEEIIAADEQATAKSLAEKLNLSKSTCYQMLKTLELRGYITHLPSGCYAVGPSVSTIFRHLRNALVPEPHVMRALHVPAPPGAGDSSLTSISAGGPGDIWAAGVQGPAASSTPLVEHWDGSTWEIAAGLPDVGTTSGASVPDSGPAPDDVYAASPDDVWVTFQPESEIGGFFGGVGTPGSFLHWDGSTWTTVPVPAPREFGMVYDLMGISGSGHGGIWAVGDLNEQGDSGAVLPFIEQVYHLACR